MPKGNVGRWLDASTSSLAVHWIKSLTIYIPLNLNLSQMGDCACHCFATGARRKRLSSRHDTGIELPRLLDPSQEVEEALLGSVPVPVPRPRSGSLYNMMKYLVAILSLCHDEVPKLPFDDPMGMIGMG